MPRRNLLQRTPPAVSSSSKSAPGGGGGRFNCAWVISTFGSSCSLKSEVYLCTTEMCMLEGPGFVKSSLQVGTNMPFRETRRYKHRGKVLQLINQKLSHIQGSPLKVRGARSETSLETSAAWAVPKLVRKRVTHCLPFSLTSLAVKLHLKPLFCWRPRPAARWQHRRLTIWRWFQAKSITQEGVPPCQQEATSEFATTLPNADCTLWAGGGRMAPCLRDARA